MTINGLGHVALPSQNRTAMLEFYGGRHAGQDKGLSVYTRDPDGNLLEFILYDAS